MSHLRPKVILLPQYYSPRWHRPGHRPRHVLQRAVLRPDVVQAQDVVVARRRLGEHVAEPQHVAVDAAHRAHELVRTRLEARRRGAGHVERRAGDRVGRHAPVDVEVQARLVAEVLVGAGEPRARRLGCPVARDFDVEAFEVVLGPEDGWVGAGPHAVLGREVHGDDLVPDDVLARPDVVRDRRIGNVPVFVQLVGGPGDVVRGKAAFCNLEEVQALQIYVFQISFIAGHVCDYRPLVTEQPRTPHERQPAPGPCRRDESRCLWLLVAGDVRRQLVRDGKAAIAGLFVGERYSLSPQPIVLEPGVRLVNRTGIESTCVRIPGGVSILI
jgi:hypothetical protein